METVIRIHVSEIIWHGRFGTIQAMYRLLFFKQKIPKSIHHAADLTE